VVLIPSGTRRRKCVPKLANANKLNSVDKGTFPFFRSEDVEEERSFHKVSGHHPKLIMSTRRLLYVACTRAQSLLYILYTRKRQVAGKTKAAYLSDFVAAVCEKDPVCVIIPFSGLDSFNSSSRVSSVLTSLNIHPRIELSYRPSCIDQFRMKKKLNAEFLNCKPARFLWV
jgi:ATP-dependent exoDNAse (exonuclease V) beta subunit